MAKKADSALAASNSSHKNAREQSRRRAKKGRKRRGPGHPPFEPTEKQRGSVNALSAAGYTQDDIAAYVGIDPKTLRKHFDRELRFGTMELVGSAIGSVARGIKADEAWAVLFVLKTRGKKLHNGEGWREYDERFPPPPGAGSDAVPVHLASLRDDQLLQLLKRLKIAAETADRRAIAASLPTTSLPIVGSSTGNAQSG